MKKIELKEENCITELQIRAHALHTVIEDQENNYFNIGDSSMLAYYFHQAKDRSYMMITLANEMIKLSDELERISNERMRSEKKETAKT
ncbi:hypothetical protein [Anaerostipes sp.]|uniref:hypothetical protein n=1 Tax=Anaerostipes sp. TaxID=1872530 RepID=UPI00257F2F84|nr:hypothetical protein [Anaerostipes sp.]